MVVPGAWLSIFGKWLPVEVLEELVPFLQHQGLPGFASRLEERGETHEGYANICMKECMKGMEEMERQMILPASMIHIY